MNREYNKPLIDRNMKTCSETYQFEKDLKWENPAPGVNRQIMAYDGQLMMVKEIGRASCRERV